MKEYILVPNLVYFHYLRKGYEVSPIGCEIWSDMFVDNYMLTLMERDKMRGEG